MCVAAVRGRCGGGGDGSGGELKPRCRAQNNPDAQKTRPKTLRKS